MPDTVQKLQQEARIKLVFTHTEHPDSIGTFVKHACRASDKRETILLKRLTACAADPVGHPRVISALCGGNPSVI